MRGPFYIYIHAPAFAPAPPHDARIFPEFLGVKRVFVSKFLRTYKDPSLVGWIGEFKRSLLEGLTNHLRDGDFIFPG